MFFIHTKDFTLNVKNPFLFVFLWTVSFVNFTRQDCPTEVYKTEISVTWPQSSYSLDVGSYPLCIFRNKSVTRNCNGTHWLPPIDELPLCNKKSVNFDLKSCPPGYYRILENGTNYCYQITMPSSWNYPCFKSGGASVITDLNELEVESLLSSLNATAKSKYFWLPAQREKLLQPLVWSIPGPKWGHHVESKNSLKIQASILKNCMLLDVENKLIKSEVCHKAYPSLCFYLNELQYPVECPKGYHAFRFISKEGACYGIERSPKPLTFLEFTETMCQTPMSKLDELKIFKFRYIADFTGLRQLERCWFLIFDNNLTNKESNNSSNNWITAMINKYEGAINRDGDLDLVNTNSKLTCMACEHEIVNPKTVLQFHYEEKEKVLYLTVYSPSGLWKYDANDKGIRCFSNAKGFFKTIEISDLPLIAIRFNYSDTENVEKLVYLVNRITNRSAEYWCEGHSNDLSLISTKKIVVGAEEDDEHVFALVILVTFTVSENSQTELNTSTVVSNLASIFNANKVLIMDILNYTNDSVLTLVHLHVTISKLSDQKSENLVKTLNNLQNIAESELSDEFYDFVNISSSMYCLPNVSNYNGDILNWDLTPVGHMAAPNEFCLQKNGLPVRRHCLGSFLRGGVWGEVEGSCNRNYEATNKTTFLYNFVRNQMPNNTQTTFLTEGLNFVLGDVDLIIPADIYYLSMSLRHVIDLIKMDQFAIDMGDIENMAWVMDRVLTLNNKYLRLAQTLNSTNVILDAANDIFQIIANNTNTFSKKKTTNFVQLAIKPQFVVQISFPKFTNITGIAVIKKSISSINFADMIIEPLYKNTTLEEIMLIENLELATWIPESVLNSLKRDLNDSDEINDNEMYIVINLFYNDAIFQELRYKTHFVNSRIVGISIPGFISNLEHSVPMIFKNMYNYDQKPFCGYWEFQPNFPEDFGFWANGGCYVRDHYYNFTICECYHLTHFGQLIDLSRGEKRNDTVSSPHTQVLNIITIVGSSLSLIGIFGIWVTAIVFYAWRRKAGTKVLLHLSTSIALPLVFILIYNISGMMSNTEKNSSKKFRVKCVILGALLHYSVLSSFMWMLISAILQFIRYVRVLGIQWPSRFMIKLTLIGWGVPLIPIIIVLVLGADNYIPEETSGSFAICYPNDYYLLFAVVVPICIILIINITLFVCVICAISKGPEGKLRPADSDLVSAQLRLSILLFFLLGFTWIFGVMSFSRNLLWSYLFCITSSLQGFILFIYFVICDPGTRSLWVTLMTPQFKKSSSRSSISVSSH